MPIYEYFCEACGRHAEVMQKISDPPPDACPACGGGPLSKLVSRTSFQLKGGGWYADLYASKAAKAGEAKAGEAKPPAAAEAKSEPKAPAASAPATASGGGTGSGPASGGGTPSAS